MMAQYWMSQVLNDDEEHEYKDDGPLTDSEVEYIHNDLIHRLKLTGTLSPLLVKAAQHAMKASNGEDISYENLAHSLSILGRDQWPVHENTIGILTHILTCFHIDPSTTVFGLVLYFVNSGDAMPTTLAALHELRHNLISITLDREGFCDKQRLHVQTPGLSGLQTIPCKSNANLSCSICQYPIQEGSAMYQLPCGDCFHATACLGEESIFTWLKSNKKCPNCAREVILTTTTAGTAQEEVILTTTTTPSTQEEVILTTTAPSAQEEAILSTTTEGRRKKPKDEEDPQGRQKKQRR